MSRTTRSLRGLTLLGLIGLGSAPLLQACSGDYSVHPHEDDDVAGRGGSGAKGGKSGKGSKGGSGGSSNGASGDDGPGFAGDDSGATGGSSGSGTVPAGGSAGFTSGGYAGTFASGGFSGVAGTFGGAGHGGVAGFVSGGRAGGGFAGGAGTSTTATCGDMNVETGEQCDDGNHKDGDGCDYACKKTCEQCEASCTAGGGFPAPSDCYQMVGTAQKGPAAGQPKAQLCQDVADCIRRTGCGIYDQNGGRLYDDRVNVLGCYCLNDGSLEQRTDCVLSGPEDDTQAGPCQHEFERAAESVNPSTIWGSVIATTSALGAATTMIGHCDVRSCPVQCLGISAEPGGSGGSAGMGGTAGTGGGAGLGGVGGTSAGGGGLGGFAGTLGSAGSAGSGGLDVTSAECLACEENVPACAPQISACDSLTGTVSTLSGNAASHGANLYAGQNNADVCDAVLACVRTTNCANVSYTDCICGIGADATACINGDLADPNTGDLTGPCIDPIAGALQIRKDRYTALFGGLADTTKPGGSAMARVICDRTNCAGGVSLGVASDLECFAPTP